MIAVRLAPTQPRSLWSSEKETKAGSELDAVLQLLGGIGRGAEIASELHLTLPPSVFQLTFKQPINHFDITAEITLSILHLYCKLDMERLTLKSDEMYWILTRSEPGSDHSFLTSRMRGQIKWAISSSHLYALIITCKSSYIFHQTLDCVGLILDMSLRSWSSTSRWNNWASPDLAQSLFALFFASIAIISHLRKKSRRFDKLIGNTPGSIWTACCSWCSCWGWNSTYRQFQAICRWRCRRISQDCCCLPKWTI